LSIRAWFAIIVAFLAISGLAFLVLPQRATLPPTAGAATSESPRLPAAASSTNANEQFCSQLYKSICGRRGTTRDPTGIVRPDVDGELQALRTYEEVIHKHPDWNSEQVDEELVKTIFTPKRKERIERAYNWVRNQLELFIDAQGATTFSADEKTRLKARVHGTVLQLPPPVSVYGDEPDLFTKNDVFYERVSDGTTRMRVGGAYVLNAKSWFNLIFTMAHEFAHAIDPCELRSAGLSIEAYSRLSSCFVANGLVANRPGRQECGDNDQLSETFADWMAVHVVSEALKTFATEFRGPQLIGAATNSVRDLCDQDDGGEFDDTLHPSPEVRIERIFGRNPLVREVLGCSAASTPYCDFDYRGTK
jgi:hypothetical protein